MRFYEYYILYEISKKHYIYMIHRLAAAFPAKCIRAYCREGDTLRARKLFDGLPEKEVFSFSSMIHGYASNGCFSESLVLFSQMQESQILPNSYTFVAVLLASAGLGSSFFTECIHARSIRAGFEFHEFVRTALLNSYSRCGTPSKAYRLFVESRRPILASWNAMISGFVFNRESNRGFSLYQLMRRAGITPNCITMTIVAQCCADYGSTTLCESVHGYVVKTGFESDLSLMNSVLDMYSSFRSMDTVASFFMKMDAKDVVTWTKMMGFMMELSCPSEALRLFSLMRHSGVELDSIAILRVISACSLLGDSAVGTSAHCQALILGFGSYLPVANSLIALYSRCGDPKSARSLFDCVIQKSLVSWTAMMSGYACNRQAEEALALLIRMRREDPFNLDPAALVCSLASSGELPSLAICEQLHAHGSKSGLIACIEVRNSLMGAYGRCGYADSSFKLFEGMIGRDVVTWNAMIASYGMNGRGEEAVSLLEEMERAGQMPDSITYANVLSACSHCGMVEEGLLAFEKMVKVKRVAVREEHCCCLIDMLARAGRLDDAKKLADSMPEAAGTSVWKAFLAGCRIDADSGIAAAGVAFEIGLEDAGHIVLLSNLYASAGKFDLTERLRDRIGKMGLVKNLGYSSIDCMAHG